MTNQETLQDKQVDVFIAGGGLAGLTLALQLKQTRPEISIVVAEKGKHPAPEAAFKVGESSLTGGSYYLDTILGLREYLEKEHLVKPGMRFLTPAGDNQDVTQRFELASVLNFIPGEAPPSYSLDRGKLETELGEEVCRQGVTFWDDCKVLDISFNESESHSVTLLHEGNEIHLRPRWVIDASGHTSLLKRQLDLAEEVDHDVNAAWFRVDKIVTVQDWTDDAAWKARFAPEIRRLATTHLTGKGYWIWIISLPGDRTSLGIVADSELHPFAEFRRREQAMEWLLAHEPELARDFETRDIMDFAVFKHCARGCKQLFSPNRWAITGTAGVFSDPLYSPGIDLITANNTIITGLVCRDLDGGSIAEQVEFFEEFFQNFMFDTVLRDVKGFYPLLDDSLVVAVKKIWQMAWYYSLLAPLIFYRKLADMAYLTFIAEELTHFQTLHRRVQAICQELYEHGPHQPTIGCFIYGNKSVTLQQIVLKKPSDDSDEALRELLRYNLAVLDSIVLSAEQQLDPHRQSIQAEFDESLPANIRPDIVAEFNSYWSAWHPEAELVPA